MSWAYIVLALFAGIVVPVQAGLNAVMARHIGGALSATFLSFIIGTGALALILAVTRPTLPSLAAFGSVPVWAYAGGLMGLIYVASSTFLAPKLGAATLLALVIAGQMIASLVIDQYGLVGFPENPITLLRVLGVVLLVAGVVLIRAF
ncbi:DMT family transporter [Oceanibaculum nanhaiense]|uniref:DMT family transporter n=1 Tax=Oceanibaculum nanhaiense TaxID=1909734 RepID=UPI000A3BC0F7|nr:DMT family transporter [Oceanibaculum nanhaiense]MBC7134729.1 DMT family transporter [Oceanibaculum nanhaiense]